MLYLFKIFIIFLLFFSFWIFWIFFNQSDFQIKIIKKVFTLIFLVAYFSISNANELIIENNSIFRGANGKKELLSINISDDLLSEDKDMLEDLIIASINQAQKKVDEISKSKLGSISGGLPGMPGF